jgi:hypothetical protein
MDAVDKVPKLINSHSQQQKRKQEIAQGRYSPPRITFFRKFK